MEGSIMKSISPVVILVTAALVGCRSEATGQTKEGAAGQTYRTDDNTKASAAAAASGAPTAVNLTIGELATCQPTAEVNSTVKRLLELADTDGNGQVSREEARSGLNFLLGGLFFRADENADGKITPEEGRKVRAEFEQQHPAFGSFLRQIRESTGESPLHALAKLLNVDYGQSLTIDDARSTARDALDGLFQVADANKDNAISRTEANTATWEGVRSLGRQAFAAADGNHDGYLSTSEFEGALTGSAKAVFSMADANKDGRLTESEAASAMNPAVGQLGVSRVQANR
jgi:Ca2+-binding EF-hand superfamily protein